MRRVPHPRHGSVVVGGALAPGRVGLEFAQYADPDLAVPESADFTAKALPSLRNTYLNTTLGCCTIAAKAHMQGVWTGNATGTPLLWTDPQIQAVYSTLSGYQPGNPATDVGCDPTKVLDACCRSGFFPDGSIATGWVQLNAMDPDELRRAIWLFEDVDICIWLQDSWPSITAGDGFVWDATTQGDPNDGHCVPAAGYSSNGPLIDSWGDIGTITWRALQQPGSFVAALLSPEILVKGQAKSSNGVDWTTLAADLAAWQSQDSTTPGESEFA